MKTIKKLLLVSLLSIGLFSCDTADSFITYNVKYIPEQNIINYNGDWVMNMDDNDNVLNNISIRPYIDKNSIIIFSKNRILSIRLNQTKIRLRYINDNSYEIIFREDDWLDDNYNKQIDIELVVYE